MIYCGPWPAAQAQIVSTTFSYICASFDWLFPVQTLCLAACIKGAFAGISGAVSKT